MRTRTLHFAAVLLITTVSFLLPSELRRPVPDSIDTQIPKIYHKELKTPERSLFSFRDPVPISPQDYVKIEAKKYGWSEGKEWDSLYTLVKNESGWRTHARNSSSGAAGLFQALPESKIGAPLDDVAAQARFGCKYIKNRYGKPSSALAQWQARSPHWY